MEKLGWYEGAPVNQLRSAARRAFDNVVRLAMAEGVDFMLIAGDLYDGDRQDYNTALYFSRKMHELALSGIRVFVVAGNHDAANAITHRLSPPDNVHVFSWEEPETVRLDDINAAIHGRSFSTKAERDNLAAGFPPALPGMFNVGLLHTSLTGRPGHEPYAPCGPGDLAAAGYDYWALGHVHTYEEVSRNPWIVFPGNVQGRNVRECGDKGCLLVRVGDTGAADVEFRSACVARWERVEVDAGGMETANELPQAAAAAIEERLAQCGSLPAAVRVGVTGATSAHEGFLADPEKWTAEVRAAAMGGATGRAWIEQVIFATRPTAEHEQALSDEGPMGELADLLREAANDPELLAELGAAVKDMADKLPRELRNHADGFDPLHQQTLARLVEQAGDLLVQRLTNPES